MTASTSKTRNQNKNGPKRRSKKTGKTTERSYVRQHRCSLQNVIQTYNQIIPNLTEQHLAVIKRTPFYLIFKAMHEDANLQTKKAEGCLDAIIKTFDSRMEAFNIGMGYYRIHKSDIRLIFGINDGKQRISFGKRITRTSKFSKRVFPEALTISVPMLKKKLPELSKERDNTSIEDTVRLLCLLLIGSCFLCTTTGASGIAKGYYQYFDDIDKMKKYDWSGKIADTLLESLKKNSTEPKTVRGCTLFLLYLFCEHSKDIQPKNKNIPRFTRWKLSDASFNIITKNIRGRYPNEFTVEALIPTAIEASEIGILAEEIGNSDCEISQSTEDEEEGDEEMGEEEIGEEEDTKDQSTAGEGTPDNICHARTSHNRTSQLLQGGKETCEQKRNVDVKSGSRVLNRSRAATTLPSLFHQLEHDGAAVQNQLVYASPLNCTGPTPDAASRKPLSVAAASIRSIKPTRVAASNTHKVTAARRIVGKTDACSPDKGKQPAVEFTGENAPHDNQIAQQDSCPSSDSSRNSNPFTLRSCRSPKKEGVSPATSSQFHLQMEEFLSENAGEHNEFQSRPSMIPSAPEFVDKDVSMDVPPGYQQKTSEIHAEKRTEIRRAHSFNLTEMAGMMNQSCSDDEEAESSIDPTLVNVEGYCVKKEVAPLLQQIFDKHKDIARDCNFKRRKNRVPYLEMVCSICQKLENASFKHVIHEELQDMSCAVDGLLSMGFDVKWLSERLEDIFTAKHLLKDYLALKEENTKIEIKQKEVDILKRKLSAARAELVTMKAGVNHKVNQQIQGLILKGLPYWDKSMLHGLI